MNVDEPIPYALPESEYPIPYVLTDLSYAA